MKEKYKVLFFASTILLSLTYIYDLPSTLNEAINTEYKFMTPLRLTMLYSVYAFPNIIIPIIFQWFSTSDSNQILELLCYIVIFGHLIYTIGVYNGQFLLMILGRFIYGIGGESCSVVLNKLISKEFANSNIAFALGMFSSISRLGSILNFSSSPMIAEHIHHIIPCGIGFVLSLISLFCCKCLNYNISHSSEKNYKIIENENNEIETNILASKPLFNGITEQKINHSNIFYEVDFQQSPYTPWESIEKDITKELFEDLKNSTPKQLFKEADTIFYEPSVDETNSYHSCFIFLIFISFTIALIWAPFYSLAPIIFKVKYNMSTIETGKLLAYMEFLGLFLNPLMGTIVDKFGKKLIFIFIGSICLVSAHLSLYMNYFSPFIISSTLGLAGPFINSYWPCIPNLVSDNKLSNGFAIIYCVLNFAYTISPIALGLLAIKDKNLNFVGLYLIILSIVTLVLSWILIYLNRKLKLGLNNNKFQGILKS